VKAPEINKSETLKAKPQRRRERRGKTNILLKTSLLPVIPAKAGIHCFDRQSRILDPRFRGDDKTKSNKMLSSALSAPLRFRFSSF
jgi:hypothetical protein